MQPDQISDIQASFSILGTSLEQPLSMSGKETLVTTFFRTDLPHHIRNLTVSEALRESPDWLVLANNLSSQNSALTPDAVSNELLEAVGSARIRITPENDFSRVFTPTDSALPKYMRKLITNIVPEGDLTVPISADQPPKEWLITMIRLGKLSLPGQNSFVKTEDIEYGTLLDAYLSQLRGNVIGPGIQTDIAFRITNVEGAMPVPLETVTVTDRYFSYMVYMPSAQSRQLKYHLNDYIARERIYPDETQRALDEYKARAINSKNSTLGTTNGTNTTRIPGSNSAFRKLGR